MARTLRLVHRHSESVPAHFPLIGRNKARAIFERRQVHVLTALLNQDPGLWPRFVRVPKLCVLELDQGMRCTSTRALRLGLRVHVVIFGAGLVGIGVDRYLARRSDRRLYLRGRVLRVVPPLPAAIHKADLLRPEQPNDWVHPEYVLNRALSNRAQRPDPHRVLHVALLVSEDRVDKRVYEHVRNGEQDGPNDDHHVAHGPHAELHLVAGPHVVISHVFVPVLIAVHQGSHLLVVLLHRFPDAQADPEEEARRQSLKNVGHEEVPSVAQVRVRVRLLRSRLRVLHFIEDDLPDGHGCENDQADIDDDAHELADLLVVFHVVRRLLDVEVGDLEQDDRLDVLRRDQQEVVRAVKVNRVSYANDQLEDEEQDQHGRLDFDQNS